MILVIGHIGNPRAYGIGIAKIFIHLLILLILFTKKPMNIGITCSPFYYSVYWALIDLRSLHQSDEKKLLSVNEVLAICFLGNYSTVSWELSDLFFSFLGTIYKGNRGTIFTREHFKQVHILVHTALHILQFKYV
ncbi:hypothetical protein ACJX0J_037417, partial [Zea mays]